MIIPAVVMMMMMMMMAQDTLFEFTMINIKTKRTKARERNHCAPPLCCYLSFSHPSHHYQSLHLPQKPLQTLCRQWAPLFATEAFHESAM